MHYVGTIPAGNWREPLEVIGLHRVKRQLARPGHVLAKIEGASLYPYLIQGDLVSLRPEDNPTDRKIIVAREERDYRATIKQVRFDPRSGHAEIVPLNPDSPSPDEVESWRPIALAVGIQRMIHGVPTVGYLADGLTERYLRSLPTGLED